MATAATLPFAAVAIAVDDPAPDELQQVVYTVDLDNLGPADATGVAVTVMVAASASFATPIGYQTNLMVYNAGGYRFTDFVRIGLPLTLLVGLVTVGLAPLIWEF